MLLLHTSHLLLNLALYISHMPHSISQKTWDIKRKRTPCIQGDHGMKDSRILNRDNGGKKKMEHIIKGLGGGKI